MASKSQRARLRRLKLATETVEDELNRLRLDLALERAVVLS